MFHGYDFDATKLRIAAMNLLLHGVDAPDIHYQDTLSNSFTDHFPQGASDAYDLILANPSFKGSLDYEDVHPSLLKKVKTKKTELFFRHADAAHAETQWALRSSGAGWRPVRFQQSPPGAA